MSSLYHSDFDITKIVRYFSIYFIVLIPFQNLPRTLSLKFSGIVSPYSKIILYSDEVLTIFLFIMLSSWIAIRGRATHKNNTPIIYFLILFVFTCFVALFINHIGMYRWSLGIYDYIKILTIPIAFYWLGFSRNELKKAILWFVNVGIIVVIIGLIGEILAHFTDSVVGVLVRGESGMRLGLFRITSVAGIGSWNYVGIYAVFIFWLMHAFKDNFKFIKLYSILIILFILCTVSRQTWIAFFVLLFFLSKGKYRFYSLLLLGIIIGIDYGFGLFDSKTIAEFSGGYEFRQETYKMCWNLFTKNPVFGVGPGMIGGISAQRLWSPYYLHAPPDMMWFLEKMHGELDQFWGRLFADTGFLGGIFFIGFFVMLGKELLNQSSKFNENKEDKNLAELGKVLSAFILALFIMGTAGGVSASLIIFPFMAFSGMYLSISHSSIPQGYNLKP